MAIAPSAGICNARLVDPVRSERRSNYLRRLAESSRPDLKAALLGPTGHQTTIGTVGRKRRARQAQGRRVRATEKGHAFPNRGSASKDTAKNRASIR